MQQSNIYIIIFSAVLTIVLGGLLSLTSVGLKPLQDQQVELDTKKKILGAVMDISSIQDPQEILKIYDESITSITVDIEGNEVKTNSKGEPVVAEKVNIPKNYKLGASERLYPVFMFKGKSGQLEAYIFPMFGAGLWDWISGYVALEPDLNTIKGIAFDHKQETPGLGARITTPEVQERYKGKKIFDGAKLLSVSMVKGEGNPDLTDYQVDGMSGATITGKGVNKMLMQYLKCYTAFMEKVKTGQSVALN